MNSSSGYPPHDMNPSMVSVAYSQDSFAQLHKGNNYSTADVTLDMRQISRTPSPTPSEMTALSKKHLFDFQAMKTWKFWFRREWLWYYVFGVVTAIISVLFTVYHEQIVHWLQPAANWMHDLPAGWLIPIAILFVISFPPLFGHEIVAILCGLVWGLWPGFAIVAAGTFIGEIGNFYAFRYCCKARADKLAKSNIQYACLEKIIQDGGFMIALIARFSAIPGHFTTAVFSTCGMNILVFMLAAFLSLPKQFLTVYLGVALEQSEDGASNRKDTIIKDVVIAVTVIVTVVAMWYIYHLMNKVKPDVIYARRKARQAKESGINTPYGNSSVLQSTADVPFGGRTSDSELPLTANFNDSSYQQWDSQGRAVGYSGDPTLHAPQPRKPARVPTGQGSSSSSNSPVPLMSQHGGQPIRQNTGGSTASWDVQGQLGGPNSYQMSRPQYSDPYSNAAPSRSTQYQQQYSQSPPPMRAVGQSPVMQPVASSLTASEQTPTQAQFADARQPPAIVSSPHSAPLPNPYAQFAPPAGPPPSSAPAHAMHGFEASEGSYYTASGSRPRTPDDPYIAYAQPTNR
ncbi:hypothetical protein PHLGIDRAFT_100340 [Phlebiopsis gigantea 11061_1 CR5-6]|uniref:Golgi apparatus membrane protein TVP38 n=1 Tax=Phlebiopsis gigantea (strain 11061_1 CR5-6) TaxID=745531 RepID=A0A0C3SCM0_PHLG1|nr:hypothetical protein PHLGIDRAFT_100340 [Phlebiopsis gigantea 11061_1 CR5-6]